MYEVTVGITRTVEGFATKGDALVWLRTDPAKLRDVTECEVRAVERFTAPERYVRGPRGGWRRAAR